MNLFFYWDIFMIIISFYLNVFNKEYVFVKKKTKGNILIRKKEFFVKKYFFSLQLKSLVFNYY